MTLQCGDVLENRGINEGSAVIIIKAGDKLPESSQAKTLRYVGQSLV